MRKLSTLNSTLGSEDNDKRSAKENYGEFNEYKSTLNLQNWNKNNYLKGGGSSFREYKTTFNRFLPSVKICLRSHLNDLSP